MDRQQDFEKAIARANSLPTQAPNSQLNLYGLFKQATRGDVNGKRPGMLDLRGRAKHDAWTSRQGMTQDEARMAYITAVDELVG